LRRPSGVLTADTAIKRATMRSPLSSSGVEVAGKGGVTKNRNTTGATTGDEVDDDDDDEADDAVGWEWCRDMQRRAGDLIQQNWDVTTTTKSAATPLSSLD
jgi:hypothetical protein